MHNFAPQSDQNYHFGQNGFLGDFSPVIFIYLLCLIMLQNLKTSLYWILKYKLASFGPESGQNCILSPRQISFSNISLHRFLSTYCARSFCKV